MDDSGARFPHLAAGYESWYLRAVHPDGDLGVWIRHTIHVAPDRSPVGSLWVTLFTPDGPPLASKHTLPSPQAADWVRIGAASFGPGHARGATPDASWDLDFVGEPVMRHLPKDWMYAAPLPRTKPVSLHPVAALSGSVQVQGRELQLDGWQGMVGHNWGTQHAERWIWLHGMDFDGFGFDTWIDVVLGRIQVAGRTTPWTASGQISIGGVRHELGGPHRNRALQVEEAPTHARITLPGARGLRVEAIVRAPRERIVVWPYADPDGSLHHAANCSIADLDLVVRHPNQAPVDLRSAGRAAFELGMREHDHGLTVQPFPDP